MFRAVDVCSNDAGTTFQGNGDVLLEDVGKALAVACRDVQDFVGHVVCCFFEFR